MTAKQLGLMLCGSIISAIIIGCSSKPIIVVPKKIAKYEMQKIDIKKGTLYVEVPNREVRTLCTPIVVEVADVLWGVIGFYEYQIDEFNRAEDGNASKNKIEGKRDGK